MNAISTDQRNGTWVDGRYLANSAYARCNRCGYARATNPGRGIPTLCNDCRLVEKLAPEPEPLELCQWVRQPGGIIRFDPMPEPMSDEDMAWCERQAERHFWTRWERANRRGGATQAQIDEALRRTA